MYIYSMLEGATKIRNRRARWGGLECSKVPILNRMVKILWIIPNKNNFNQKSINLLNLTTSLQKIQRRKNMIKTARGCSQQMWHEGNPTRQSSGFPPLNYKEKKKGENLYIKIQCVCFWPRWSNRDQTDSHPWNILKNKQTKYMKQWSSRQRTSGKKGQWSLKMGNEISLPTVPTYCFERVSRPWSLEREVKWFHQRRYGDGK